MIEIDCISKWYGKRRVLAIVLPASPKARSSWSAGLPVPAKAPSSNASTASIQVQAAVSRRGSSRSERMAAESIKLRSRIGMVFQSFDLYPHMTVMQNITLAPIKVLRRSREAAMQRAQELLTSRPRRICRPLSAKPLRRTTAARRHRARACHGPGDHAVRRADLRTRSRDDQ